MTDKFWGSEIRSWVYIACWQYFKKVITVVSSCLVSLVQEGEKGGPCSRAVIQTLQQPSPKMSSTADMS